jgi:sec-independent protein translocase protein TatC
MRLDQRDVRILPDDPEAFRMSFVEHLDDLRKRIIICVVCLGIAMVIGWFLFDPLFEAIFNQVKAGLPKSWLKDFRPVFTAPGEAFMLKMRLSFILGLIVSAPLITFQLWGFVAPGLKEKERKPFRIIIPFSVFLFFLGGFFSWMITPATIGWFASIQMESFANSQNLPRPEPYIMLVAGLIFGFGISFQLPLVVYYLVRAELLEVNTLMKNWRQAVVVIFIVAATFTPGADPFSMLMMAIPLCVLFMLSVLAARYSMRNDAKKNLEAEEIDQEQTEVYTGKSVPYRPFDESQTNDSSKNEEENRVE